MFQCVRAILPDSLIGDNSNFFTYEVELLVFVTERLVQSGLPGRDLFRSYVDYSGRRVLVDSAMLWDGA